MRVRKNNISGAVNSLLETISSDKDDGVKKAVERALIRMCKRQPNQTIEILYNHRQKCLKLPDAHVALLLRYYLGYFIILRIISLYSCNDMARDFIIFHPPHRVIDSFVNENSDQLNANCLDKVIALCVSEMTKSTVHSPDIQNPCLSVLVATGRFHCSKVMDGLLKKLQPNEVGHFMILECIGNLATANIKGTAPFIRQTLETILSTLSTVRQDHQKYAYSFGNILVKLSENHLLNKNYSFLINSFGAYCRGNK